MRKFIISVAVAGTMFAAAPASANHAYGNGGQIAQQINQLHHQIARAQHRGTISPREAKGLRRQAMIVQRNHRVLSRNGLSQREFAALQHQVQQVRYNLRVERRDMDRRRG